MISTWAFQRSADRIASGHTPAVRPYEALDDAIRRGDYQCAAKLLDAHPSLIAYRDSKTGDTPLHWASRPAPRHPDCDNRPKADKAWNESKNRDDDYHRIVEKLLTLGANPNVINNSGDTPLHLAVKAAKSHAVTVALLDRGADILARDTEGNTALHLAVQLRHNHEILTNLLFERGGTELLHVRNRAGETARKLANTRFDHDKRAYTILIELPKWRQALGNLQREFNLPISNDELKWRAVTAAFNAWSEIIRLGNREDNEYILRCARSVVSQTTDTKRLKLLEDWMRRGGQDSAIAVSRTDAAALFTAISDFWRRVELLEIGNSQGRLSWIRSALRYASLAHRIKVGDTREPITLTLSPLSQCEAAFRSQLLLDSSDILACLIQGTDNVDKYRFLQELAVPPSILAAIQSALAALERLANAVHKLGEQCRWIPPGRVSRHWQSWTTAQEAYEIAVNHVRQYPHQATFNALVSATLTVARELAAVGYANEAAEWCRRLKEVENELVPSAACNSLIVYDNGSRVYPEDLARELQAAPSLQIGEKPQPAPTPCWLDFRTDLARLRQRAAERFDVNGNASGRHALALWLTPLPIEQWQQALRDDLAAFYGRILQTCRDWMLGSPPCPFALLGLGSLSRGDCTPFSDIEYAILVDRPGLSAGQPEYRYFQRLAMAFEFAILSLGESSGDPVSLPTGIRVDSAVGATDPGTGLINTPEGLADVVRKIAKLPDPNSDSNTNCGIGYSLLTPRCLYGSAELLDRYLQRLSQVHHSAARTNTAESASTANIGGTPMAPPRAAVARLDCAVLQWRADIELANASQRLDLDKIRSVTVNLKADFIGPLTHLLTTLALVYNYPQYEPHAVLLRLHDEERFSEAFLADWRWALARLHAIRVARHMEQEKQYDEIPWDRFTDAERRDLRSIEWAVLRPLQAMQRDWTVIGKDPHIVAQRLKTLFYCDPPCRQIRFFESRERKARSVWNAPTLQTIDFRGMKFNAASMRSLAAALVQREIGFERCVAIYRDIMHGTSPKEFWTLWTAWRQPFSETETSSTAMTLATCRNLPCPDGWRAAWEEDQRVFFHHLRAWFADSDVAENGAPTTMSISWMDPDDITPAAVQTFVLNDSIRAQLVTETGNLRSKDPELPGRQTVLPVDFTSSGLALRYWVKLYPENSGTETLIHGLDCRLNGGAGTPMSTLVRLTLPNGEQVAAQIIEDAGNLSLEATLASGALNEAVIDDASFTQALLRTVLVNPEDDKGDDFRLAAIAPGRYALRRLDNERAFFKVSSGGFLFGIGKSLQVKSQLLCLEQMRQPLDRVALDAFCQLDPLAVLKSWFAEAGSLQLQFAFLFAETVVQAHFENERTSLLVVALPEGLANELLTRFEIMQGCIRAFGPGTPCTGMDLLRVVQPELFEYYQQAFVAIPGTQAELAVERFEWRTGTAYTKGWGNTRTGTIAANRAITQSLAMNRLVCWKDVIGIRNDKKFLLSAQLGFLNSIETDIKTGSRAHAAWQQLHDGKPEARQSFEQLGVRQKIMVLHHVSQTLKENPLAYPADVQVRLLRALAGVPFITLDLSAFGNVLTDELLKPLLRGACAYLCKLDISRCHALSAWSLAALAEHCPSLVSLRMRELGIAGTKPVLTEVRKPMGLIDVRISFPSLRELHLGGSHGITRIAIEAPMLEQLGLADLDGLKEVTTGSKALRELDVRGCAALTESAFGAIAQHWEALNFLQIGGCTGLLHQPFRQTFAWLADLAWNDWSARTVDRLALGLTTRLRGSAVSIADRSRCRLGVIAWRNAVADLTPVMTAVSEDGVSTVSGARGQTASMDLDHADHIASVLAFRPDHAIAGQAAELGNRSVARRTATESLLSQLGRREPEPFLAALVQGLMDDRHALGDVAATAQWLLRFGGIKPSPDAISNIAVPQRARTAPITDPGLLSAGKTLHSNASEALAGALSRATDAQTVERYGKLLHDVLRDHLPQLVAEWFAPIARSAFHALRAPRPGIRDDRDAAVSVLMDALRNGSATGHLLAAIRSMEGASVLQAEEIIIAMIEVLLAEFSDQTMRLAAASVLCSSEAFWSPTVRESLRVALGQSDWEIKCKLLPALLRTEDFAENLELLHELGYELRIGDADRRRDVIRILDEAHVAERAFIPTLYKTALKDELAEVRAWGLRGIGQICMPSVPLRRIDLPLPMSPEPHRAFVPRPSTPTVLMPWTVDAGERDAGLNYLLRALPDPAVEVKRAAARLLVKRDPADLERTLDLILVQAQQPDVHMQRYAMLSLCNLVEFGGIRSQRIAMAAAGWLFAADSVTRKSAIRLFGLLGTTSDVRILDALQNAVQDADPEICAQALRTLGMSGGSRPDRVINLLEMSLKARHFPQCAVEGLGHIGPMHIERVSALLKQAMADQEAAVRLEAVAAAARMLQPEAVIDALFDHVPAASQQILSGIREAASSAARILQSRAASSASFGPAPTAPNTPKRPATVTNPGEMHSPKSSAFASKAVQPDTLPLIHDNNNAAPSTSSPHHVARMPAAPAIRPRPTEPEGHVGERPWIASKLWELHGTWPSKD